MSGSVQGIPQRMTAFVDKETNLVTDTWWRFLQTLWVRTGGAVSVTGLGDLIEFSKMADVPTATPPDAGALLGFAMFDAPQGLPDLSLAMVGDVVMPTAPEAAALLAAAMADIPRVPENDPALVALMVA